MLNKKNVMLFTDWYVPGFKAGGPIRSCKNLVDSLGADFTFYIVTSDRDIGDLSSYPGIQVNRWINLDNDHKIYYAAPGTLTAKLIVDLVSQVGPNTIYLNSLFSRNFTILPLWALRRNRFPGKIVLAPRGMLKRSALDHKKWKKAFFLRVLNLWGFYRRVIFHATDEQEKTDILTNMGAQSTVVVAPNIPNLCNRPAPRNKIPGELDVIYLSRIHPVKNLLFALQALKKIEDACLIRFDVYGAIDDQSYYEKCFQAARLLEKKIEIQFMGPVDPAEVFETLQQYHLLFLPTKGENFGHSIFESLSSACPVLISDQTPWNNISRYNGGWALPLDEPGIFAGKISEVCKMDNEQYQVLCKGARSFAEIFMADSKLPDRYKQLLG